MSSTVKVELTSPTFTLLKVLESGCICFEFKQEGTIVQVHLPVAHAGALSQQTDQLINNQKERLSLLEEAETWRTRALVLNELGDRSLQVLLRECQADGLLEALWFLNNRAFAKKVFKNMSERAAKLLAEDLFSKFYNVKHKGAGEQRLRSGLKETQTLLEILEQLRAEGLVEEGE